MSIDYVPPMPAKVAVFIPILSDHRDPFQNAKTKVPNKGIPFCLPLSNINNRTSPQRHIARPPIARS
jgi:hypothetical protein